jgi:hypothetical protein
MARVSGRTGFSKHVLQAKDGIVGGNQFVGQDRDCANFRQFSTIFTNYYFDISKLFGNNVR